MPMGFDFDAAVGAPFRMQPGLRRLPPGATQLTPARPGSRHMREKLAVLSAFAGQALLQQPGFDAAPALDALCRHAAAEHGAYWRWDGQRAEAPRLGVAVGPGTGLHMLGRGAFGLGDEVARCLATLAPEWRLAGLLALAFEEDLAIIDGRDAGIPWLAVCLPSNWAPEQKIGRHFSAVHAPVADSELLRKAGESLARLVTGAERWERFVWNVTDHPRLHAHPARVDPARWTTTPVEVAWWRTERQTFVPVRGHDQAVFTIHVQVQALAAAIDTPERARRLHDAVASMSPAVLQYRALTPVREPLLAWLAARMR